MSQKGGITFNPDWKDLNLRQLATWVDEVKRSLCVARCKVFSNVMNLSNIGQHTLESNKRKAIMYPVHCLLCLQGLKV